MTGTYCSMEAIIQDDMHRSDYIRDTSLYRTASWVLSSIERFHCDYIRGQWDYNHNWSPQSYYVNSTN